MATKLSKDYSNSIVKLEVENPNINYRYSISYKLKQSGNKIDYKYIELSNTLLKLCKGDHV